MVLGLTTNYLTIRTLHTMRIIFLHAGRIAYLNWQGQDTAPYARLIGQYGCHSGMCWSELIGYMEW